MYYIYENWTAEDKAIIHDANCRYCNNGNGIGTNILGDKNGKWHGPFMTKKEAEKFAIQLKREVIRGCKVCS